MDITMENLKLMNAFMSALDEKCSNVINWKSANDPEKLIWNNYKVRNEYLKDFCFNEDSVEFEIEETWAFGGHETHHYSILFSELVSDDWKEEFIQKVAAAKHQLEEKEKKEKQLQKEKWEQRQKALYESLKEKYEGK